MRDAVNDYLEASGANRPSIGGEETCLAHRNSSQPKYDAWAEYRAPLEYYAHARRRKRILNRLAIDCIYALFKEVLSKVDRELEEIVGDLPLQQKGVKR